MGKFKILGRDLKNEGQDKIIPIVSDYLELTNLVEVTTNRSQGEAVQLKTKDDDIIDIFFEDGGEWIGSAADFVEIFGEDILNKRGVDEITELPSFLATGDHRGVRELGIKFLGLFSSKKAPADLTGEKIAEVFDKKIMPDPGLFKLSKNGVLDTFDNKNGEGESYLLFIHGTASSTEGSFGQLREQDKTGIWEQIFKQYKDQVLALEHRTVSVSPVKNAIDVLHGLPSHSKLDIITHSRGGLVGDVLARCGGNVHAVFSEVELKLMDEGEELELMKAINELAKEKSIEVNKVIRIACPAQGTILLSERLDHFLNGLLKAVGMAFGGMANQLYQLIRSFVVDVIKSRATPDIMPGLNAMIPNSSFQRVINNPHVLVKSHLAVVEGVSEFGGDIKHSIAVIFANLFYQEYNDFVVNTNSMRFGARREHGIYIFRSKDSDTSHFNYFSNKNSQQAIKDALTTNPGSDINGFEHRSKPGIGTRGVALSLFDLGEEFKNNITGQRPIVILLPGIMGSNLEVEKKKIWIDLKRIRDGELTSHLGADQPNVVASSLIEKYYTKLVNELSKNYDVLTFPYDWRHSLTQPAEVLKNIIEDYSKKHTQPIKIIAHSMGGLVVRNYMLNFSDSWKKFIEREGSRFVMLGTPWLGSYLIVEFLTACSNRLNQLALLDFTNSKKDLLDVFSQYKGIYELLPLDRREFEKKLFWENLIASLGSRLDFDVPPDEMLHHFRKYKNEICTANYDFTNVFYIAGKKDGTVHDYDIRTSLFGSRLKFKKTPEGDGSVTWKSGIPKDFPVENLYFTYTEHGQLANDEKLFAGIKDLLKEGATSHFLKRPPSVRTASYSPSYGEDFISNEPEEAIDILFGIDTRELAPAEQVEEIEVSISHADLKLADYPLMVGHFQQDGIISAERILDKRFNGILSERHLVGNYPGKIGESEILFIPGNNPVGAIIVGLGEYSELTPYELMKSVEMATLKYAMHLRDNTSFKDREAYANAMSSLCVGSAYANMPMESALGSILRGISRANVRMDAFDSGLHPIQRVEFVELFEHVANSAYFSLQRIQNSDGQMKIKVLPGVTKKHGGLKKLEYMQEDFWWHEFSTKRIVKKEGEYEIAALVFQSSSGRARVEEETMLTSEIVVDALLKELSQKSHWDKTLSKTLFEILVPNSFKDIIRNQSNILWKLDVSAASYPWEMFHDHEFDKDPTFVNAGLIRQLVTSNYRDRPQMIKTNSALVIGDPIYTDMPMSQLPAAKEEGKLVHALLLQEGFESKDLIGEKSSNILNAIFNKEYRILHIAGHGVYNPKKNEIGAVLGNNIFLSPQLIKKLSKIPEFVFINCCYSGQIKSEFEEYYQDRYKMAANLGVELINMGVKAAVITGWAVHDGAAAVFAKELYEKLLDGYFFGEAVMSARKKCYQKFELHNTWGAYQCYGDQWYKLVRWRRSAKKEKDYISHDQIMIELYNLKVTVQNSPELTYDEIEQSLKEIVSGSKSTDFYDGQVIEKEAEIYRLIGKIDMAVKRYEKLLSLNKATFSVKSLEQYCNLRAKILVRNKIENDASGMKGVYPNKEVINNLVKDLETILRIGHTPERLSLLGSAHKRIAQITKDKIRSQHLNTMIRYYRQAYELVKNDFRESLYPLNNWVTGFVLRHNGKKARYPGDDKTIIELLEEVESKLQIYPQKHLSFWMVISTVNVYMCKLLVAKDQAAIDDCIPKIVRQYERAWQVSRTRRYLRTETEHLDFIKEIWEMNALKYGMDPIQKGISEAINKIHTELNKWT